MLTRLLSIDPPKTVVVALCVIVAVAEDLVSLDILTMAIVWDPDWKTAPVATIPKDVAKGEEATACFPETHSSVWRPICPSRRRK